MSIKTLWLVDFAEAIAEMGPKEFAATCPYPSLVELDAAVSLPPLGAGDGSEDGVQRRIRSLAREDRLKAHLLIPGAAADFGPGRLGMERGCEELSDSELFEHKGLWRLRDMESQWGTYVEAQRLPTGVAVPLADGQQLTVCGVSAVFLRPESLFALATLARQGGGDELVLPPEGMLLVDLIALTKRCVPIGPEAGPFLVQIPRATDSGHVAGERTQAVQASRILGAKRSRVFDKVRVHALRSEAQADLVAGRDSGCDLVIFESSASRRHARFTVRGGVLRIIDLESQNGTFVDGERLPPGVSTPLRPGQTVSLACYSGIVLASAMLLDMVTTVRRTAEAAA